MVAPIGKTNAVVDYGNFYSSTNNATEPCFAESNYGVNAIWGISGQYELSDRPRGVDGKTILVNGSGLRGSRCSFLPNIWDAHAADYRTAKRWQATV